MRGLSTSSPRTRPFSSPPPPSAPLSSAEATLLSNLPRSSQGTRPQFPILKPQTPIPTPKTTDSKLQVVGKAPGLFDKILKLAGIVSHIREPAPQTSAVRISRPKFSADMDQRSRSCTGATSGCAALTATCATLFLRSMGSRASTSSSTATLQRLRRQPTASRPHSRMGEPPLLNHASSLIVLNPL